MTEKTTILVVDDDTTNLEILEERLKDENFEVISAESGEDALAVLDQEGDKIKLIILDWMMPGLSGIDLLEIIKDDDRWKEIPVIMQTAKAYSEDMVTGINAGACQYLTKPFSKKLLIALVNSSLKQQYKFHQLSADIENHKEFLLGCATRMMKRQEEMRFDLQTHHIFNNFSRESLSCKTHQDLAQLLLKTINQFSFESAGETDQYRKLRCSIKIEGEEKVEVSDRGMTSGVDALILSKAMGKHQVLQNGRYTIIPSQSKLTAVMIRNTPLDEEEADKAINAISTLLERFDGRLLNLEYSYKLIKKNNELKRKNSQIRNFVRSCRQELNQVNDTYQYMKGRQMELFENIADKVIGKVNGLTPEQVEAIRSATGVQLLKSMELYSADMITDQKFQLTIQKIDDLLTGRKTVKMDSASLGKTSQDEVDDLLDSLGLT